MAFFSEFTHDLTSDRLQTIHALAGLAEHHVCSSIISSHQRHTNRHQQGRTKSLNTTFTPLIFTKQVQGKLTRLPRHIPLTQMLGLRLILERRMLRRLSLSAWLRFKEIMNSLLPDDFSSLILLAVALS